MNLERKISKALRFVLAFTMALAICIGSFSVTNYTFKAKAAEGGGAVVATLSIHSDPSQKIYGNHAFLSIRNKSKKNLDILGTYVQPDCSITISTYPSHTVPNPPIVYGDGIYTNLDAYLIKYKGEYKERVSLSMDLTSPQLKKVISNMTSRNTWTAKKNCAWFAVNVWNSVASNANQLNAKVNWWVIDNPVGLADSIKTKKGWKKAAPIGICDKKNVRKYNVNGSKLILPRYIDIWYP